MADKGGTDRGTSFKDKDKKGVAAAAAAEDGEVDDTAVKHLSLDFQSGQRILSRVHILCQVRAPAPRSRHAHRARPPRALPAAPRARPAPRPTPLARAPRASGSRPSRRWTASRPRSTRSQSKR